jgi:beta-lactamase regulating signal transducer with metallopeptidase domain/uncharacterized membrane protein YkoI
MRLRKKEVKPMISEMFLTFFLNALWQVALVVLAAAAAVRLLRGAPARYLYLLWAAALLLSLLLPAATALKLVGTEAFFTAVPAADAAKNRAEIGTLNEQTEAATTAFPQNANFVIGTDTATTIFAIFILFTAFRGVGFFRAWLKARAVARNSYEAPVLPQEIRNALREAETGLGCSDSEIRFSSEVSVPVTIGHRRPMIILPEQFLCETDHDVLLTAVGHELVHIGRRDYFFNLLFEVVCLPMSFHPAAICAKRRITEFRELCCDEVVATRLMKADVYARSLLNIAGSVVAPNRLSTMITVGITDAKNLEVRIMSLIKRSEMSLRKKSFFIILAVILLAVPTMIAAYVSPRVGVDRGSIEPVTQATPPTDSDTMKKEFVVSDRREILKMQMVQIEKALADPNMTDAQKARFEEARQQIRREFEVVAPKSNPEVAEQAQRLENEKLARVAKITMDQAVSVALAAHPGKLVKKGIGWANDEVVYKILIDRQSENGNDRTVVVVSGMDGEIRTVDKIAGEAKKPN